MSVIRVGSTTKYAEGWGAIFAKAPAGKKGAKKSAAAKKGAKKAAGKAGKGARRK
ncbi:MAG: hypothetical protein ACKO9B_15555 [Planctomycetota bacterium]